MQYLKAFFISAAYTAESDEKEKTTAIVHQ